MIVQESEVANSSDLDGLRILLHQDRTTMVKSQDFLSIVPKCALTKSQIESLQIPKLSRTMQRVGKRTG
jgi:hypothetical protein